MIFRLENKEFLIGLMIIPLMLGAWWLFNWLREEKIKSLGEKRLVSTILPALSSTYRFVKYTMLLAAIILIVAALVNPQTGEQSESTKTVGLEVNIVLDVSNSMLATDIKPSRMEAARKLVYSLSNRLSPNKVGVTIFAGEAFNQMPPTTDAEVLESVIASISPESVPTQGSNLRHALEIGSYNFNKKNKQKKFMIFISDGESHEERFMEKAKEIRDAGIVIHTIGVGTAKGSTVSIILANGKKGQLRDEEGKIVKTALNEKFLSDLASTGGGIYARVDDENSIDEIIKTVQEEKKEIKKETIFSDFTSYFPYLIGLALAIVLTEFFMPLFRLNNPKLKN